MLNLSTKIIFKVDTCNKTQYQVVIKHLCILIRTHKILSRQLDDFLNQNILNIKILSA